LEIDMATIQQCDFCGKLSPDKEGYFIANDWFEVEITERKRAFLNRFYRPQKLLLCRFCKEDVLDAATKDAL